MEILGNIQQSVEDLVGSFVVDMTEAGIKVELYDLLKEELLQPQDVDENKRLRYNYKEGCWHLWSYDENELFDPGFTKPDFILKLNENQLLLIEIKSCYFDHIPGKFSYCMALNQELWPDEVEEELENGIGKYKKVSCKSTDHIKQRAYDQAVVNGKSLKMALPDRHVIHAGVVCVYDFQNTVVKDFKWQVGM